MDWLDIAVFAVIAAVASYVQAITGFAFGLIMVGASSIIGLAPIELTVAFVSFSALASALISMRGTTRHIRWDLSLALMFGSLPATLLGFYILDYLSDNHADLVKQVLGVTIFLAGGLLMLNPSRYVQTSGRLSFVVSGFVGGLMGGAFSVPGPPIVYHLYRQPLPVATIKATLLLVFSVAYILRISLYAMDGLPDGDVIKVSALSFPLVLLGTLAGKHRPPGLSDQMIRRCAFVLLSAMGMIMFLMA